MPADRLLIAFDTSTEAMALGAARDLTLDEIGDSAAEVAIGEAIAHTDSIPARRCANQKLLTGIEKMMLEHGFDRSDITGVICGRGPGSFTGARIGVATAKGIALGLGCPLYGVSTLDAVAWEIWSSGGRGRLGVVGDALRKEIYPVRYVLDDFGVVRLDHDSVDKPALLAPRWAECYAGEIAGGAGGNDGARAGADADSAGPAVAGNAPAMSATSVGPVMLAGDGLVKFADLMTDAFEEAGVPYEIQPEERWVPTGRGLILAYHELARRGALGSGDPQMLLPVYTRLSDAEENERARKAKGLSMRGVLVNPVDFVEKSDTPEELDPSSADDVPASGVAPGARMSIRSGEMSEGEDLSGISLDAEHPLILAIETSCDETAAAVVDGSRRMVADLVATQVDFHRRFGGVVPEIASRKHTEAIVGVVDQTMEDAGEALGLSRPLLWSDLDAIAVTQGPGLIGALVVGMAFAKGLSWATGLPLIGVNHLEGHIYANQIADPSIRPPLIVSLLSGGHTMLVHVRDWGDYEVLGQTLDDAVGEAFDKVSKALGLGYPGGPVISRYAAQGDSDAISFPRAMLHSHDFRFSLSGLKTAVMEYIKGELAAGRELNLPDLAASFQQAVVDVQVAKALEAVRQTGVHEFCLGGGVAANPQLRQDLKEAMEAEGIHVTLPDLSACTDNAGMIAAVALDLYREGRFIGLDADSIANMEL